MITISIKTIWDPSRLVKAAERAKVQTLRRSAAILRSIMRNRIKFSKRGKSRPGQTFIAHTRPGIKNMIKFAPDGAGSMIIGPTFDASKQTGGRPVPSVLEHGGRTVLRVDKRGRNVYGRGPNVERKRRRVVNIQPRPFAQPALEAFKNSYGPLWRDCIK